MRDRLRHPRVIAAALMVKESKHSPRLPDSTVNWDSLSILIMISDKQRRAKFTLILFTERRHVGRGGIIHLKRNQCIWASWQLYFYLPLSSELISETLLSTISLQFRRLDALSLLTTVCTEMKHLISERYRNSYYQFRKLKQVWMTEESHNQINE